MTVTFLGSGTSSGVPVISCECAVCRSDDPRNRRDRASVLLRWGGRNVVVDTGPEFRLQVLREKVRRLDAVLVTHEHADHIYGLDDVRFFTLHGGTMPLYASKRTADYVRSVFPYIFDGTHTSGTFRPNIAIHTVNGPFELFGETVTPIPVMHGSLPILGFRVRDFAYVTDCSGIPAESEELLRGVDTLVLGALRQRPHPTHFSLSEAIEAARRIGPRMTYFTHIGHEMDHAVTSAELPKGFALAYDGLSIGEGK
ncbi:MAG TPA: MBL fold metallo-hydrolase [Armatimonadota bacterium]